MARVTKRRGVVALLYALVVMLVLPLATSGALPQWARLAGIEAPHVCHCSIEKHDCVCARCNPENEDMLLTSESLQGRCGDDDVAFPGKAIVALPAAPTVRAAAPERASARSGTRVYAPLPGPARSPPVPPPRSSSTFMA
jgi:hypothetical protein